MLIELRAENYAVIDHAIAVFGPGLNLLTGETGAGKSIIIGALGSPTSFRSHGCRLRVRFSTVRLLAARFIRSLRRSYARPLTANLSPIRRPRNRS